MAVVKGGGGALLREKIVAANSKQLIIVADESKLVKTLGRFPLPVEVVVFGWEKVFQKLESFGCIANLRLENGDPYITDNSNYILDCSFKEIPNPSELHDKINAIVGVVENGLFINLAKKLVAGYSNGDVKVLLP